MANAALGVVRTNGSAGQVTVDYSTISGGTATPGVNYKPTQGTLTFGNGEAYKPLLLPLMQNTLLQGPVTVFLALSHASGGAEIKPPGTAAVTIADDDAPAHLRFQAPQWTVNEDQRGVTVTVLRLGSPSGPATVDWSSSGPDKTSPAGHGTLHYSPGQVVATFRVPFKWDHKFTGDRTISLSLQSPTGAVTLDDPAQAQVVVHDIDAPPPGRPKLSVIMARRQRAAGNPGIVARVRTDGTLRLQGSGSLTIGRTKLRLKHMDLVVGVRQGRVRVVVPFRKGTWKVVGRALNHGQPVTASVRLTGTDALKRHVRVTRRVRIVL
jgi:hypothetical protein